MSNSKSGRFRAAFWIRLFVGIALLAAIMSLVRLNEFFDAFRSSDVRYVAGACMLLLMNLGTQMLKWKYMLGLRKQALPTSDLLASFFFGLTLGSITPGQIGEYGGRAVHLPPVQRGTIIGLAVIDKLQVFGVMAMGGIISSVVLLAADKPVAIALAAIASVSIAILLVRFSLVQSFLQRIGFSRTRFSWINQATDSLALLQTRDIIITLAYSIFFYGIVFVQLYLLLNALQPIDVFPAFLGYAAMMFSKSLLPFSIADLGIREIGLVYFLSLLGYPQASALAASIMLFVINIVAPSLFGLFYIPHSLAKDPNQEIPS